MFTKYVKMKINNIAFSIIMIMVWLHVASFLLLLAIAVSALLIALETQKNQNKTKQGPILIAAQNGNVLLGDMFLQLIPKSNLTLPANSIQVGDSIEIVSSVVAPNSDGEGGILISLGFTLENGISDPTLLNNIASSSNEFQSDEYRVAVNLDFCANSKVNIYYEIISLLHSTLVRGNSVRDFDTSVQHTLAFRIDPYNLGENSFSNMMNVKYYSAPKIV